MPEYRARPGEWQQYRHDNGAILDFRFIRSARRTIALYVHRDGTVLVRAPTRAPFAEVILFIRERWDWLQKQLIRFSQEPAPRQQLFQEGECLLHLGEELRLRLMSSPRPRALMKEGELFLAAPSEEHSVLSSLVEEWQRLEAKRLFPERLALCHQAMQNFSLPFPQLKIRKMRSRWGSCSRSAVITLNLELIRMPLECIDYVITHELCHLVEFNHSPRFYALQESVLPDWKERRGRLEALARLAPR